MVFVRLDLNLDQENGQITDDFRLKQIIPTLQYLLDKNLKLVLASHWGRPNGKVVLSLRLDKIAKLLEAELRQPVLKLDDSIERVEIIESAKEKLILLENLRFYSEEEKNDSAFARKLAGKCDFYVNDAFSASHRYHASIVAICDFLPAAAGFLFQKELKLLGLALKPKRSAALILGGSKLDTKLPIIDNLLPRYDYILIGGAVANTLLKERGVDVKRSLVDDCLPEVKSIINETKIILPVDYVWSSDKILDIGPKTIIKFKNILAKNRMIVWNGPLGLYETKPFNQGTENIGKYLSDLRAFKIIGGGDTIDSLKNLNIFDKINHISTAGGAMLEFLAGEKLPGIAALESNTKFNPSVKSL